MDGPLFATPNQETTEFSCIDIRFNDFKGYPNLLVSFLANTHYNT